MNSACYVTLIFLIVLAEGSNLPKISRTTKAKIITRGITALSQITSSSTPLPISRSITTSISNTRLYAGKRDDTKNSDKAAEDNPSPLDSIFSGLDKLFGQIEDFFAPPEKDILTTSANTNKAKGAAQKSSGSKGVVETVAISSKKVKDAKDEAKNITASQSTGWLVRRQSPVQFSSRETTITRAATGAVESSMEFFVSAILAAAALINTIKWRLSFSSALEAAEAAALAVSQAAETALEAAKAASERERIENSLALSGNGNVTSLVLPTTTSTPLVTMPTAEAAAEAALEEESVVEIEAKLDAAAVGKEEFSESSFAKQLSQSESQEEAVAEEEEEVGVTVQIQAETRRAPQLAPRQMKTAPVARQAAKRGAKTRVSWSTEEEELVLRWVQENYNSGYRGGIKWVGIDLVVGRGSETCRKKWAELEKRFIAADIDPMTATTVPLPAGSESTTGTRTGGGTRGGATTRTVRKPTSASRRGWSPEEDALLSRWVIEHTDESVAGGIVWEGVSELVRGREVENCKKRWELLEAQVGGELDTLEEGADQGDIYERKIQLAGESVAPWSPLEDVLLARWVLENSDAEAGISWSGVSELVVGRDEESCQDRWEMLERMTEASERRRRGRASTSLKRKKTKTTTTTKANSSRSKSTKTKAKPTARKR